MRNGGGIYAFVQGVYGGLDKPKFTITRSTVDNNQTDEQGGGIFVCEKFSGNFVATNSTFSANHTLDTTAGAGGGLFIATPDVPDNGGDAYLRNITVTQNTSADGGGVRVKDEPNLFVRIANSIISQNFDLQNPPQPNNLVGPLDIANVQYNLIGSGSTVSGLDSTNVNYMNLFLNDNPLLSGLANHGGVALPGDAGNASTPPIPSGPAPMHVLLANSLAIDRGSNVLASDPLTGVAFTSDQAQRPLRESLMFPDITTPARLSISAPRK